MALQKFDSELLWAVFIIWFQPFNDYLTIYTITQRFTRLPNNLTITYFCRFSLSSNFIKRMETLKIRQFTPAGFQPPHRKAFLFLQNLLTSKYSFLYNFKKTIIIKIIWKRIKSLKILKKSVSNAFL